jgi:hypothetical protein
MPYIICFGLGVAVGWFSKTYQIQRKDQYQLEKLPDELFDFINNLDLATINE